MILALLLIALVLTLWALLKLPPFAQGALMVAVLVVAFGWLGAIAAAAGLALGLGIVIRG